MDVFDNILLGLNTAISIQNLLYAFLGCLLGTLIGVLPGLGPLATISMLLPFTFGLDPITGLIMLAGIYYGSAYGGSTTAILVNLPGETSSVVTVIDGHKMAQQGRAGVALSAAAIGSFFAGCFGTLMIALFAKPLTSLALQFGAAEYFSLMLLGLIAAVSLTNGSTTKAIGMILIGIIFGLVGTDMTSGTQRFTFGESRLWDGIDFVVIAVGVFAFGEIFASLEDKEGRPSAVHKISSLWPRRDDMKRMVPPILRGTLLGSVVGILPGAGLSIASFLAYSIETRVSRFRHMLGKGAIEGVAGPESANNAAAQTAFIPTLTLGIPGSATMALMLGAMVMHNIQPGPQVMANNPELFWGLIASMWIGNLMLVMLNLPLVGIWVRLLRIPYDLLFPAILLFSCIGVYASNFAAFDLCLAVGFGLAGYVFRKIGCEPAPLVLGFILGPMLENNLRRALVLSQGDYSTFLRSPISMSFLLIAALLLLAMSIPKIRRQRDALTAEE